MSQSYEEICVLMEDRISQGKLSDDAINVFYMFIHMKNMEWCRDRIWPDYEVTVDFPELRVCMDRLRDKKIEETIKRFWRK